MATWVTKRAPRRHAFAGAVAMQQHKPPRAIGAHAVAAATRPGATRSAMSIFAQPRMGPSWSKATIADKLLSDYILYAVGVMYLYNFVAHTVFAETSAAFIGWANSPFQYEVGYASLGFGVAALVAHRSDFSARLVAVLGPSLCLWGAAAGHVREILMTKNFAPGNAGVVLWTDIFLPVIGFAFLYFYHSQRPLTSASVQPSAV